MYSYLKKTKGNTNSYMYTGILLICKHNGLKSIHVCNMFTSYLSKIYIS